VKAGVVYLDTSALVKLLVEEPESAALLAFLEHHALRATSVVAEVEVLRAVRRLDGGGAIERRAVEILGGLHLVELDKTVRQLAAALPSPALRSLDAIHLASALVLGESLHRLLAYDERLLQAARAAGLEVAAPGQRLGG
jgi:predicted nucleic acid-binding protein